MNLVSSTVESRASQELTLISCSVKQHPYVALLLSFLVFLGPWILLLPLFLLQATFFVVLYILGFGLSGIIGGKSALTLIGAPALIRKTEGSPAALYQSFCYGGHTPSSSLFAMMQSTGTQYNVGTASSWVLVCIRVLAGIIGVYVLVGIIRA